MTSYLFLAPGFEELEAIAPADVLRRAGMDVMLVAVTDGANTVVGSHGFAITADLNIQSMPERPEADWLICPGGMPGATNLYECHKLREMLRYHASHSGNIAAICASPGIVLGQLGLLKDRRATCYPGFEKYCTGATMIGSGVVTDGNIITGKGPAWALDFGLAIVEAQLGEKVAASIAAEMQHP